jgi:hypothetical protein
MQNVIRFGALGWISKLKCCEESALLVLGKEKVRNFDPNDKVRARLIKYVFGPTLMWVIQFYVIQNVCRLHIRNAPLWIIKEDYIKIGIQACIQIHLFHYELSLEVCENATKYFSFTKGAKFLDISGNYCIRNRNYDTRSYFHAEICCRLIIN